MREDYSRDGTAWDYFPHDHARSRAYRWSEDGLGGHLRPPPALCFALALWNGKDPILKERPFGLTNSEGNHGEDVKEYWFYLDSTPTHSYMKYLYKYPQAEYPYAQLIEENRRRDDRRSPSTSCSTRGSSTTAATSTSSSSTRRPTPEDILIAITVENRGPEAATLDLLPTVWFRNTWSWRPDRARPLASRPCAGTDGRIVLELESRTSDGAISTPSRAPSSLFTENETNAERLFGAPNPSPYVKDAFHELVVRGNGARRQPGAARHEGRRAVPSRGSGRRRAPRVRLRLTDADWTVGDPLGEEFEQAFSERCAEADEFYAAVIPARLSARREERHAPGLRRHALVQAVLQVRRAPLARRRPAASRLPPPRAPPRAQQRLAHVFNADVLSMPDTWEFPWFAAWDLAFHCVVLSLVDAQFAKDQLVLMLREWYMHPNGQIPAYEWNFADVNPPVHAWAALRVYQIEHAKTGKGDRRFSSASSTSCS